MILVAWASLAPKDQACPRVAGSPLPPPSRDRHHGGRDDDSVDDCGGGGDDGHFRGLHKTANFRKQADLLIIKLLHNINMQNMQFKR